MTLPTQAEIEALHHKYALSEAAFEVMYGHCQIVWEITRQLLDARPQPIDRNLVKAGCLLHDIGCYHLYQADGAHYLEHGPAGATLLKQEGFPSALCDIAAHHTGVGITRAEILKHQLPLPPADYLAQTPEERLVMYADKFHSKWGDGYAAPRFNTFESYSRHVSRFGPAKVTAFEKLRAEFGEPDLQSLAAQYRQPIT